MPENLRGATFFLTHPVHDMQASPVMLQRHETNILSHLSEM